MSQYPSFLLPKQEQTVKPKKDKKKDLKVDITTSSVGSGIKIYAREKLVKDIKNLEKQIEKQKNIIENYDEYLISVKDDLKHLKETKEQLEKLAIEF